MHCCRSCGERTAASHPFCGECGEIHFVETKLTKKDNEPLTISVDSQTLRNRLTPASSNTNSPSHSPPRTPIKKKRSSFSFLAKFQTLHVFLVVTCAVVWIFWLKREHEKYIVVGAVAWSIVLVVYAVILAFKKVSPETSFVGLGSTTVITRMKTVKNHHTNLSTSSTTTYELEEDGLSMMVSLSGICLQAHGTFLVKYPSMRKQLLGNSVRCLFDEEVWALHQAIFDDLSSGKQSYSGTFVHELHTSIYLGEDKLTTPVKVAVKLCDISIFVRVKPRKVAYDQAEILQKIVDDIHDTR